VERQVGLYAQDQVKLGSRWAVTLSGRMDWVKSTTTDLIIDSATVNRDKAFTGRAGIVYETRFGLAPYVSYSTSFSPVSGTDIYGAPYEPETGAQWEAGVKFQPRGQAGLISLAAFDLRRQNILTIDPDNPSNYIQHGEWRSRGIEAEATVRPLRALNLSAAYSFMDVKVTKSNDIDLDKVPTTTPKHLASFWFDYTVIGGVLSGVGVGGGVRYLGSTFGDLANELKVPAYTLVDLSLQYRFQQWRLAVHARNLLDNETVSCWDYTACNYGDRRVITASVGVQW
jgi:iron complex outermembrane receptor protein